MSSNKQIISRAIFRDSFMCVEFLKCQLADESSNKSKMKCPVIEKKEQKWKIKPINGIKFYSQI
jgi:hypothetical protein